jgi:hypothetical protein
MSIARAVALVAAGVAIGVGGVYFADYDDSPGAGAVSILLMIGAIALAVRIARRKA